MTTKIKSLKRKSENMIEDVYWGDFEQYDITHSNFINKTTTNTMNDKSVFELTNSIIRKDNEIYYSTGVNNASIQEIIKLIMNIISDNKKTRAKTDKTTKLTITYVVDSPGGSVTAVLKFVDFLDLMRKKYEYIEFVSIITGCTASAGTIMAIVADKRYMTKNAYAMIHELSSANGGKMVHMRSYTSYLEKLHSNLANIYLEKNKKITSDKLEDLLIKESWYTAQEYFDAGFVDEIK